MNDLELTELIIDDARRYRWLRSHACNSLRLSKNHHADNYVSAKDWIENYVPEQYDNISPEELQRMKDTDTIWSLQIYPNTPVGFNEHQGSDLNTVIDAAIRGETE